MKQLKLIVLYLALQILEVSSIVTHSEPRNFRRHVGVPSPTDWELGLREAVHQALLREHYTDPGLRDHLLGAPLINRHDKASPFGDIAVLARGQLYVTPGGFQFVQDNDCEDCHHTHRSGCHPEHHHKLLALWTVKRIRHRDPHRGHIFEIEYTISPVTAVNEELIRGHGFFNYNIPGHIFVVKSDPRVNYLNDNADDKWYKSDGGAQYPHHGYPGSGHFRPGIVIGVTPDGQKHVLHSLPGFYSSYHPQTTYDQTTIDPKEYELYKKLIESLASKTSHVPHRFSVNTPKDRTTVPTTRATYQIPSLLPAPQTTVLHLVPLTENTLVPTRQQDLHIVTPVKLPTTAQSVYYHTQQTTASLPTPEPPKPITVPVTTIHYYTPVEQPPETIKTTQPNKPSTVATFKPSRKTTSFFNKVRKTTKPTTVETEEFDLFPIAPTEPMKPSTENPEKTRPSSVNEQLPPPEKDTDTTVPYVSSTVTQPTITNSATTSLKSPRTTTLLPSTKQEEKTTMTIEKIPYTEIKTTTIKHHDKSTVVTENTYPATVMEIATTLRGDKTTTENVPSTQRYTTTMRKTSTPTTIVEYSFDSTIQHGTTNVPTIYYPTTETAKYPAPPTTTHYYYTFETDLPPSTITTQGTTIVHLTETPTLHQETSILTTPKKYTQTPSTNDDFLSDVEGGSHVHSLANSKKDFSEDDIFGKATTRTSTTPRTSTTKKVQSDFAQTLFGNNRRSKRIRVSSRIRRPITSKPIYNNFYAPSTATPTPNTFHETTTNVDVKPYTDQSYSTSISVEVNKRNSKSRVVKVDNQFATQIPLDDTLKPTTESSKSETKKVFEDAALQLVNHARTIDYLHQKSTRQPHYKRRSFSTKSLRSRSFKKIDNN